jgi:hypothetical protein
VDARLKAGHDELFPLRLLGDLALKRGFNAKDAEVSRRYARGL